MRDGLFIEERFRRRTFVPLWSISFSKELSLSSHAAFPLCSPPKKSRRQCGFDFVTQALSRRKCRDLARPSEWHANGCYTALYEICVVCRRCRGRRIADTGAASRTSDTRGSPRHLTSEPTFRRLADVSGKILRGKRSPRAQDPAGSQAAPRLFAQTPCRTVACSVLLDLIPMARLRQRRAPHTLPRSRGAGSRRECPLAPTRVPCRRRTFRTSVTAPCPDGQDLNPLRHPCHPRTGSRTSRACLPRPFEPALRNVCRAP